MKKKTLFGLKGNVWLNVNWLEARHIFTSGDWKCGVNEMAFKKVSKFLFLKIQSYNSLDFLMLAGKQYQVCKKKSHMYTIDQTPKYSIR